VEGFEPSSDETARNGFRGPSEGVSRVVLDHRCRRAEIWRRQALPTCLWELLNYSHYVVCAVAAGASELHELSDSRHHGSALGRPGHGDAAPAPKFEQGRQRMASRPTRQPHTALSGARVADGLDQEARQRALRRRLRIAGGLLVAAVAALSVAFGGFFTNGGGGGATTAQQRSLAVQGAAASGPVANGR
jgi:hypothetical protein